MKFHIPLAKAEAIAAQIVDALKPFCSRIEVAGSIRRKVPFCGDIDLVCLPNDDGGQSGKDLRERITANKEIIQDGPQNIYVRMHNGVEVNAYIAHAETKDFFSSAPCNFGSLLILRTGPRAFNIALVEFAKQKGFEWKTHHGLFHNGAGGAATCVAAATEEEIFKALDLDYINPADRDVARRAGFFPFAAFKLAAPSAPPRAENLQSAIRNPQ